MSHTKGVLVESAGPSNIFADDCDLTDPGLRETEHLGSFGATSTHGNGCKRARRAIARSPPARAPHHAGLRPVTRAATIPAWLATTTVALSAPGATARTSPSPAAYRC